MPSIQKPILALDAAFGQASACLMQANGESFYANGKEDLPHSQAILPLLEQLLHQAGISWQGLGMLAIGIGPGSFTGLRVAAASIAGINAALKLPLITLSSLAVTVRQSSDTEETWVIEDARSGDAYIGHYMAGKAVEPDRCLPWEQAIELPITCYTTLSDSTSKFLPDARPLPLKRSRPEALECVIESMLDDPELMAISHYPIPAYIRPSQAERNARSACGSQKAWPVPK